MYYKTNFKAYEINFSNDNAAMGKDALAELIAAQDMFAPDVAAQIMRQSLEKGMPIQF